MYVNLKRFTDAYALAEKLYGESKNLDYLIKVAVANCAKSTAKLSLEVLQSIMKKFDEVTTSNFEILSI